MKNNERLLHNGHTYEPGRDEDAFDLRDPRWCNTCGEGIDKPLERSAREDALIESARAKHDPACDACRRDGYKYVLSCAHFQRVLMDQPTPRAPELVEAVDCHGGDNVNHPPHYTGHPSGIECITITEHMGFNLGNAVKYIWRADLKNDAIEDLRKARWYIDRELKRRGAE